MNMATFEQAVQKIRTDVVVALTEAKATGISLTEASGGQFGCIGTLEGIQYTMEIYNDIVLHNPNQSDPEEEHFCFVNCYHSDNCESNIVLDAITNSIDPQGHGDRELEWLVTEWDNSADLPGSGKNSFGVQILWIPGRGTEGGRGVYITVNEKLMCRVN